MEYCGVGLRSFSRHSLTDEGGGHPVPAEGWMCFDLVKVHAARPTFTQHVPHFQNSPLSRAVTITSEVGPALGKLNSENKITYCNQTFSRLIQIIRTHESAPHSHGSSAGKAIKINSTEIVVCHLRPNRSIEVFLGVWR